MSGDVVQADYDVAEKANVAWGRAINGPHVAVLAAQMARLAAADHITRLESDVEVLREALQAILDASHVGQAHRTVSTRSRYANYEARHYHKAREALSLIGGEA